MALENMLGKVERDRHSPQLVEQTASRRRDPSEQDRMLPCVGSKALAERGPGAVAAAPVLGSRSGKAFRRGHTEPTSGGRAGAASGGLEGFGRRGV